MTMQPTQSAAQVCLFVFLLRMISAALPCQCQNKTFLSFLPDVTWARAPTFPVNFFFCLLTASRHALFPFPVKNGHFLVSLQRASLSEFLDGIWNREEKKKAEESTTMNTPFDLLCIYCKVIREYILGWIEWSLKNTVILQITQIFS